jgi:general nucleoside transport system permease protein
MDLLNMVESNRQSSFNKRLVTRAGRLLDSLGLPFMAVLSALIFGAAVIWITSGSLGTVLEAYDGLLRGAFFRQRGLSETLVAAIPYIFLALGVAVAFKTGLFNIGIEGQFYTGALCAAWVGQAFQDLPASVHLPLALLAGAAGGALWAAIPGYIKARTGAHEVINTIMLNFVAFRLIELLVNGPLKDPQSSAIQTRRVSLSAQLWTLSEVPSRLQEPANAFGVALLTGLLAAVLARWYMNSGKVAVRKAPRRLIYLSVAITAGMVIFFGLPALFNQWGTIIWPFQNPYDRLHIGLVLALLAAPVVWWLLYRTTIGFEMRTLGANPEAARCAGVNMTRTIVTSMAISGGLAGIAGTIEVLGVSICRCLPMFFSSGYGFDSIAIALVAKNHPIGVLAAAFFFGAMRNGADLMELQSGVSKYVVSLIQALALLFVAAPNILRWIYRHRPIQKTGETPLPNPQEGSD